MGIIEGLAIWAGILLLFRACLGKILKAADHFESTHGDHHGLRYAGK